MGRLVANGSGCILVTVASVVAAEQKTEDAFVSTVQWQVFVVLCMVLL